MGKTEAELMAKLVTPSVSARTFPELTGKKGGKTRRVTFAADAPGEQDPTPFKGSRGLICTSPNEPELANSRGPPAGKVQPAPTTQELDFTLLSPLVIAAQPRSGLEVLESACAVEGLPIPNVSLPSSLTPLSSTPLAAPDTPLLLNVVPQSRVADYSTPSTTTAEPPLLLGLKNVRSWILEPGRAAGRKALKGVLYTSVPPRAPVLLLPVDTELQPVASEQLCSSETERSRGQKNDHEPHKGPDDLARRVAGQSTGAGSGPAGSQAAATLPPPSQTVHEVSLVPARPLTGGKARSRWDRVPPGTHSSFPSTSADSVSLLRSRVLDSDFQALRALHTPDLDGECPSPQKAESLSEKKSEEPEDRDLSSVLS